MKLRLILFFSLVFSGKLFAQSPLYAPTVNSAKALADDAKVGQLIAVTDGKSPAQFRVIAAKPSYATEDNFWYIKSGSQWMARIVDSTQTVTVYDSLQVKNAPMTRIRYDGSEWVARSGNKQSDGGLTLRVSASRYWERSNDGVINPKWFGVRGDTSDCTSRLRRMFTVIPAGSVVRFQNEGAFFKVSGEIMLTKKVTIIGDGFPIFKQVTPFTSLFRAVADGVEFQNIVIQQTGKGDEGPDDKSTFMTSYGAGIVFCRVNGGRVSGCTLLNCGDHLQTVATGGGASERLNTNGTAITKSSAGVYITGSSNIFVTQSAFKYCLMGVNVDDFQNVSGAGRFYCNNNRIEGNVFEDNLTSYVIDVSGVGGGSDFETGTFSFNKLIKTAGYAPGTGAFGMKTDLYQSVQSFRIEGNKILGTFQEGIAVLKGGYFTSIKNNYIDGCTNAGINLITQAGYDAVRNLRADGNIIKNCLVGFRIQACLDISITGGEISANQTGVQVLSYSFNVSMTDVSVFRNKIVGIDLRSIIGMNITGCRIFANGYDTANGGTSSAITINSPNASNVVSGVSITNNVFDYNFSSNPSGASQNAAQTYYLKATGSYFSASVYSYAGKVENNYIGSQQRIDDMAGSGLLYNRNVNNLNAAVDVTPVYSKTESDARYLLEASNQFGHPGTVTDLYASSKFALFSSAASPANAPNTTGVYFQGIQFSANNNAAYANILSYDENGNIYTNTKNNNTWGTWTPIAGWKYNSYTSGSNLFSGSKSHMVVTASGLTHTLVSDGASTVGVIKIIRNEGATASTLNIGSGVTLDGTTTAVNLPAGSVLMIIATSANTWKTIRLWDFYDKTASDARYVQGTKTAASADAAAAVGASYSQAEVQAILTELRDLKTKMRSAGLLLP